MVVHSVFWFVCQFANCHSLQHVTIPSKAKGVQLFDLYHSVPPIHAYTVYTIQHQDNSFYNFLMASQAITPRKSCWLGICQAGCNSKGWVSVPGWKAPASRDDDSRCAGPNQWLGLSMQRPLGCMDSCVKFWQISKPLTSLISCQFLKTSPT